MHPYMQRLERRMETVTGTDGPVGYSPTPSNFPYLSCVLDLASLFLPLLSAMLCHFLRPTHWGLGHTGKCGTPALVTIKLWRVCGQREPRAHVFTRLHTGAVEVNAGQVCRGGGPGWRVWVFPWKSEGGGFQKHFRRSFRGCSLCTQTRAADHVNNCQSEIMQNALRSLAMEWWQLEPPPSSWLPSIVLCLLEE